MRFGECRIWGEKKNVGVEPVDVQRLLDCGAACRKNCRIAIQLI